MKKVLCLILSLLLCLVTVLPAFAAEKELVLAENGETDYVIVVSETATDTEKNAAAILADYLQRICGAVFATVTDDTVSSDKEIVVGVTNRDGEADLDYAGYGEEGVRILTQGDKLFLTGGKVRGSIYSVYTFLEEYLGCRWFTETLTVVPEADRLIIPAIDYTYIPCFRLRQTVWGFSTAYKDYCVAQKLHGVMAYVTDDVGGCAQEYCINSVHTLGGIITRDKFDLHPEYFGADENGVRTPNRQPCLTNADVFDITVSYAKNFFASYNTILSISQNDGMSFCQCENCRAFKNAHGGTDSACMLDFVNRVAKAVRETYPEARFETLAYQDSLTPPTGLTVEKDVTIRMCPVNGCVLHDFDDPACEKNAGFNKAMEGWAALTDNIYMWNYSTDFQYYYALFPNITTLQNRFRYFRDHNVIGVFDNGCGDSIAPGEFHELKTYLVLKLMWDPDTDVERHISEFCNAYYGEAGADVVDFINDFEKAVKGYNARNFSTCHMTCQDGGQSLENNTSLSELDIKKLDKIMARAEARDLTAGEANRLEGLSLSWRFFKNATFAGEFNWLSPTANPAKEAEKLYNDMKDYGINILTEGGGLRLDMGEPDFTHRPTWWFASADSMPMFNKLESTVLPVINKVIRTLFWFLNIGKGTAC